MSEYVGLAGIKSIASRMNGDENILIGVRPFGFHAGNVSADVVYPLLLCEELLKQKKVPRLNITFYMNDYEQFEIIGHPNDLEEDDEVNIYPKGKTLQYEKSPINPKLTMVEYWGPIIIAHMDLIKQAYPNVRIRYLRTSDLNSTSLFRDVLNVSINKTDKVASVFSEVSGKRVHLPAEFVRVVCPSCEIPIPETKMDNDIISASCRCGSEVYGHFSSADYWLNHNMVGLAKLTPHDSYFLWMLGYDHKQFHSGDIKARIMSHFGLAAQDCNRVYAPLLLREDGRKMSKSSNNIAYARISDLIEKLRKTEGMSFTMPDSKLFPNMQEITLGDYRPE